MVPNGSVDFVSIYVLTEAGKPVFVRSTSDDAAEHGRICSFISTFWASVAHGRLGLGNVKSVQSGRLRISFMKAQSIILVAAVRLVLQAALEAEVFPRLLLEHVYAHLLALMTRQALDLVRENPSFDIHELMRNEDLSSGLLDTDARFARTGAFLTGGIEPFFPLSPHVRDDTSLLLRDVTRHAPDCVFAMVLSDARLVTLVQLPQRRHRISSFDLQLFVAFIYRQPRLLSDDLWFPFCFPRFDASGFLHCYTHCLDAGTRTVLVLVTLDPSNFSTLRSTVATKLRPRLGLPAYDDNAVLEILDNDADHRAMTKGGTDVSWRRSGIEDTSIEEDYDFIPYMHDTGAMTLLTEIRAATAHSKAEHLIKDLMSAIGIQHFVFRLDVPVECDVRVKRQQHGALIQCICSDTSMLGSLQERQLWDAYQKLSLRLRLGSVADESVFDAFDALSRQRSGEPTTGIGSETPAAALVESPPDLQGVCYIVDGDVAFFAMNGQGNENFEIYITTSAAVCLKDIASHGAKLARRLIVDQRQMFLFRPSTWSSKIH